MGEIKWIRLDVSMFDNRKIKYIRKLPDGDRMVLVWIMLLTRAGRCNSGGMIHLTQDIPYTVSALANDMDVEESVVDMALTIFERLDMVTRDEAGFLTINNWEEHQNIEGLERIREQNRLRKQKQRMLLAQGENSEEYMSRDGHTDVTQQNKNKKENKNKIKNENREEREGTIDAENASVSAPAQKHKHGYYKNVLLTDEDIGKLKAEFPQDWESRIERLSEYIASTGKKYKSHLATIRNWARRDGQNGERGRTCTEDAERESGYGEFL